MNYDTELMYNCPRGNKNAEEHCYSYFGIFVCMGYVD